MSSASPFPLGAARDQMEGTHERALRELNFESVFSIRLGSAERDVCRRLETNLVCRPSFEYGLRLMASPRLCPHAPENDASIAHRSVDDVQRHCGRDQCKGERRPVSDLQITGASRERSFRHVHRDDELTWKEDGVLFRARGRNSMKLCDWNGPLTTQALQDNARVQSGERHRHVRGIGGNAGITRPENCMHARVTTNGTAPTSWEPL